MNIFTSKLSKDQNLQKFDMQICAQLFCLDKSKVLIEEFKNFLLMGYGQC